LNEYTVKLLDRDNLCA